MKKKILYIVYDFYQPGGIGRMLRHKIDAWKKYYNYDVVVLTVNQKEQEIFYKEGADFKLIDCGIDNLNNGSVIKQSKFLYKVWQTLYAEKPHAVISSLTGIPSLLLPWVTHKYKTFLEIHGSGHFYVTSSWKYKWCLLNKYKGVVLLNNDEKKYYKLHNLFVVPNFIEPLEKSIPDYSHRKKIVVSAGRIHKEKQIDHLIKIWRLVYSTVPEWELHIYGERSAIQIGLEEYIEKHNIKNVFFKGVTNAVDDIMQSASIFCLTSETEAFGLVLLECKKNGLPVISYDCENGPRNVLSNDGVLILPNNVRMFADALNALMHNPQKLQEMSENASENVYLYSAENIIRMWNELMFI